jgi:hypothetical protein
MRRMFSFRMDQYVIYKAQGGVEYLCLVDLRHRDLTMTVSPVAVMRDGDCFAWDDIPHWRGRIRVPVAACRVVNYPRNKQSRYARGVLRAELRVWLSSLMSNRR